MIGWHHQINGHEFDQAVGDGETQGSLACYSPLGFKESDMTEQLNNNSLLLSLREINYEYSLQVLMLKLKLHYFGHLMQRANSLEKTLILGKTEGKRRIGRQSMRWLDNIINSMDMNLSKLQEIVKGNLACCSSWGHKQLDMT